MNVNIIEHPRTKTFELFTGHIMHALGFKTNAELHDLTQEALRKVIIKVLTIQYNDLAWVQYDRAHLRQAAQMKDL